MMLDKNTETANTEDAPRGVKSLSAETRALLHRHDLRAKKSLGQHFLVDRSVLRQIIAASDLNKSDVVMEIGPGLGVLTRELALRAGQVIAVEVDRHLAEILREELHSFDNVRIVNRDILELTPESLMEEMASSFAPSVNPLSYRVVANLPYYITSAVLKHFLTAGLKPTAVVVMVQKEVARAIVARPGDMSLLAVSVQLYGQPAIVRTVPAKSFYPAPEVDSAILKIELFPRPQVSITDEASFFTLVRAGFSASRKQIVNSLAQGLGLPKQDTLNLLEEAGVARMRRAETLTLEEWIKLWRVYAKTGEENANDSGSG
ncbi:MAG: 16S rRNA (adenine(1518)-N(6)/adenine(1519)-N(6))-dimethyltransferase RsmA [Chloroflexota bacterium]